MRHFLQVLGLGPTAAPAAPTVMRPLMLMSPELLTRRPLDTTFPRMRGADVPGDLESISEYRYTLRSLAAVTRDSSRSERLAALYNGDPGTAT